MNSNIPLPKKTRAWIISRLKWSNSVPTAAVALNGQYQVLINRTWWGGLTMEQRRAILLHEIAHIWRGDCLAGEGREPRAWNIATDAVINRTLRDLPPGGVDYKEICDLVGLDSGVHWWNAIIIYHRLVEAGIQAGDARDLIPGGDPMDHVRERTSLEEAIGQDGLAPDQLPGCTAPRSAPRAAGRGAGQDAWTPGERGLLAVSVELHQLLGRHQGRWEPSRSWRRAGRISLLRGSGRRPKPAVGVYVDLSGSTYGVWERLGAIARSLRRQGAEIWAYDDGVRPWDGARPVDAGGGTAWAPVAQHIADHQYSAVVVCTDGYFADTVEPIPGVEVVWVITPGGQAPTWGRVLAWPEREE